MSEQLEDVVANLKQTSAWQRVFFTLGFALLFNVVLVPLALLMVLVQVIFTLLGGEKNARVAELGEQLVAYIVQIVEFLFFLSERKPFPFSDFPGAVQSAASDMSADEQGSSSTQVDEAHTPEESRTASAHSGPESDEDVNEDNSEEGDNHAPETYR